MKVVCAFEPVIDGPDFWAFCHSSLYKSVVWFQIPYGKSFYTDGAGPRMENGDGCEICGMEKEEHEREKESQIPKKTKENDHAIMEIL